MTIPKEFPTPNYLFPESMNHSDEYLAVELVQAMQSFVIERQGSKSFVLPSDSIAKDVAVSTSETIALPAGSRALSGIVLRQYENLEKSQWVYERFGMHLEYSRESNKVTAQLGSEQVIVSTEQTYVNYSEPAYQRMIFGVLACLSEKDIDVLQGIRERGVLITTLARSTETALLLPGTLLTAAQIPRLAWQGPFQERELYPFDLWADSYVAWNNQGRLDVAASVRSLLSSISPVGVLVQSDTIGNVFLRKQSLV